MARLDGARSPGRTAVLSIDPRGHFGPLRQTEIDFSPRELPHQRLDTSDDASLVLPARIATRTLPMTAAVQDLLALLDLEPIEVNMFRGRSPQVGWQRVFGG
jgi:hypothetical protein